MVRLTRLHKRRVNHGRQRKIPAALERPVTPQIPSERRSSEDSPDRQSNFNLVYRECEDSLMAINAATDWQQIINDEILRHVKFEKILSHKMESKARRVQRISATLKDAEGSLWLISSIDELAKELWVQAESQQLSLRGLETHHHSIQRAIDSHHELMKMMSKMNDTSWDDLTSTIASSRSPRHWRRNSNSSARQCASESTTLHTNAIAEADGSMSFRTACQNFEKVRKLKLNLSNKMDYLQANLQTTEEQIQAKATLMEDLMQLAEKSSHTQLSYKWQATNSQIRFLQKRKQQVEREIRKAQVTQERFHDDWLPSLVVLLHVVTQHKQSIDVTLQKSVNLLSSACLSRDSQYHTQRQNNHIIVPTSSLDDKSDHINDSTENKSECKVSSNISSENSKTTGTELNRAIKNCKTNLYQNLTSDTVKSESRTKIDHLKHRPDYKYKSGGNGEFLLDYFSDSDLCVDDSYKIKMNNKISFSPPTKQNDSRMNIETSSGHESSPSSRLRGKHRNKRIYPSLSLQQQKSLKSRRDKSFNQYKSSSSDQNVSPLAKQASPLSTQSTLSPLRQQNLPIQENGENVHRDFSSEEEPKTGEENNDFVHKESLAVQGKFGNTPNPNDYWSSSETFITSSSNSIGNMLQKLRRKNDEIVRRFSEQDQDVSEIITEKNSPEKTKTGLRAMDDLIEEKRSSLKTFTRYLDDTSLKACNAPVPKPRRTVNDRTPNSDTKFRCASPSKGKPHSLSPKYNQKSPSDPNSQCKTGLEDTCSPLNNIVNNENNSFKSKSAAQIEQLIDENDTADNVKTRGFISKYIGMSMQTEGRSSSPIKRTYSSFTSPGSNSYFSDSFKNSGIGHFKPMGSSYTRTFTQPFTVGPLHSGISPHRANSPLGRTPFKLTSVRGLFSPPQSGHGKFSCLGKNFNNSEFEFSGDNIPPGGNDCLEFPSPKEYHRDDSGTCEFQTSFSRSAVTSSIKDVNEAKDAEKISVSCHKTFLRSVQVCAVRPLAEDVNLTDLKDNHIIDNTITSENTETEPQTVVHKELTSHFSDSRGCTTEGTETLSERQTGGLVSSSNFTEAYSEVGIAKSKTSSDIPHQHTDMYHFKLNNNLATSGRDRNFENDNLFLEEPKQETSDQLTADPSTSKPSTSYVMNQKTNTACSTNPTSRQKTFSFEQTFSKYPLKIPVSKKNVSFDEIVRCKLDEC